eukprot:Rmarinus@m.2494
MHPFEGTNLKHTCTAFFLLLLLRRSCLCIIVVTIVLKEERRETQEIQQLLLIFLYFHSCKHIEFHVFFPFFFFTVWDTPPWISWSVVLFDIYVVLLIFVSLHPFMLLCFLCFV